MAKQWKEIALVLRDRQFDETEDLEIDIFDVEVNNLNEFFLPIIIVVVVVFHICTLSPVPSFSAPLRLLLFVLYLSYYYHFLTCDCFQCKHWGIVLRHIFGVSLGTGDYGHLTIEHAPMLMRRFRSMTRYSNQGFEAAHKLQRQLYSRATNHDCLVPASSCE